MTEARISKKKVQEQAFIEGELKDMGPGNLPGGKDDK